MDIFNILEAVWGLCLFLFGMSFMSGALERLAGGRLSALMRRLTENRAAGLLTGIAVTAVMQSSTAATVMVVGFVSAGLMSLRQAINVIMGANIGTCVTAWIFSLNGISGASNALRLLSPSVFTPLLALVGTVLYLTFRTGKKRDLGSILLGFSTLMFGLESMTGALSGIAEVEGFRRLFTVFENPILGVLAGTALTAVIQSSSASIGVLQALSASGQVSYAAAVPIILGQNIGTCATALLSAVGAGKDAKRAAAVHLMFNVLGSAVWLAAFFIARPFIGEALAKSAGYVGISAVHTAFNLTSTLILLPFAGQLEKAAVRLVRGDGKDAPDKAVQLDERLLATPSAALAQCSDAADELMDCARRTAEAALRLTHGFDESTANEVRRGEEKSDKLEDELNAYLVKLSSRRLGERERREAARLLRVTADCERICDHALNIAESLSEAAASKAEFSPRAENELRVLTRATGDIVSQACGAFVNSDEAAAAEVEPLGQFIDTLKSRLRPEHIVRMQRGECSVGAGIVWEDICTDLERIADHCSNIAQAVMGEHNSDALSHEYMSERRSAPDFKRRLDELSQKYGQM